MENSSLKAQFIKWIEGKTDEAFTVTNPFLLACLDEKIELMYNSTINNVPFLDYYSTEEIMKKILLGWQTTSISFLRLHDSNINITFREINLPDFEIRNQLMNELSDLVAKCK